MAGFSHNLVESVFLTPTQQQSGSAIAEGGASAGCEFHDGGASRIGREIFRDRRNVARCRDTVREFKMGSDIPTAKDAPGRLLTPLRSDAAGDVR